MKLGSFLKGVIGLTFGLGIIGAASNFLKGTSGFFNK